MKARRENKPMLIGVIRRGRTALLLTTALQAVVAIVLSLPAVAQPAPNARPTGGSLVTGTATISQDAARTTINQTSSRAAINWQSFDVGSQQRVQFNQPSSAAVTLNRVLGPSPSAIAGRIDANGQVVLINQSGVVFYKGAQVNTAGLMVSAAGMSNENFMAGHMNFDQPAQPNARVENQGRITVKEAGIAALVAPQVANSGVINAKLGHVVLAGARAATLDLYGDGLLSIDVTRQVTETPIGPDGKAVTTLVTNTGAIRADGGTVQLTAGAADGVIQTLVGAGGHVRTATVGGKTGTIALNGVGGSIVVEGQLSARGSAPGTKGGAIEVVTTGSVTVASTAKINASGKAGGGVVAIGTTLDRAKGGPSVTPTVVAASTVIQPGAKISADGTNMADGGRVTVLSTQSTDMAGTITAKGGKQGGNGGFVEVSGDTGFSLNGSIDVSAPKGVTGSILLDPQDLFISATDPGNGSGQITPNFDGVPAAGLPNATTDSWITPSSIAGLTGTVTVSATRDLSVLSTLNAGQGSGQTLFLRAGGNLTTFAPVSNTGDLNLIAGNNLSVGASVTSTRGNIALIGGTDVVLSGAGTVVHGFNNVTITATVGRIGIGAGSSVSGNTTVALNAGAGGIELTGNAALASSGSIDITSGGPVTAAPTSIITTSSLTSSDGVSGNVSLLGIANAIGSANGFTVTNGDLVLVTASDLTLFGTLKANNLFFEVARTGGTLTLGGSEIEQPLVPATLTAAGTGGRISLVGDTQQTAPVQGSRIGAPGGTVELTKFTVGSPLTLMATPDPTVLTLEASTLRIGRLATEAPPRAGSIRIAGPVDYTGHVDVVELDTTGTISQAAGATVTTTKLTGQAGQSVTLTEANQIATLGAFTAAAGSFNLVDNAPLTVTGPLSAPTVSLTAPSITIPGAVNGSTSVLLTAIDGGINEVGAGAISTPLLAGSAPGPVTLNGTANAVATLGDMMLFSTINQPVPFDATGQPFSLTTAIPLKVNGVTAATVALTAPSISILGTVVGTSSVQLTATTGGIGESGSGSVTTPLLTGGASGTVALTGPGNTITALGSSAAVPFADPGQAFSLTTTNPLTVNGLTAGTIALKAPSIAIPGTVSDGGSGTVSLTATTGGITETGSLIAGTLSGSAATTASLTGATVTAAALREQAGQTVTLSAGNHVDTLAGFTVASGDFVFTNSQPLTMTGLLSAPNLRVLATGQITLAGNIATNGAPVTDQVGAASGSYLWVRPGESGAGNIVQTGTSTISGLSSGPSTLRLQLPPTGGSISLNDLEASKTNLVLGIGGGTATGFTRAGTLSIVWDGMGGGAALSGSVAGDAGPSAATLATIYPSVSPAHTFNGCEIAAGCTPPVTNHRPTDAQVASTLGSLVQFQLVPTGLPDVAALPRLMLIALPSLAAPRRQLTDPDVVPPNVSVLDY